MSHIIEIMNMIEIGVASGLRSNVKRPDNSDRISSEGDKDVRRHSSVLTRTTIKHLRQLHVVAATSLNEESLDLSYFFAVFNWHFVSNIQFAA